MTNEENAMNREDNTGRSLEDEIINLKDEIARLRYARHEVTYKLEQAVRERDRLARHVASLA
jgi:chromosome segregation ATPase